MRKLILPLILLALPVGVDAQHLGHGLSGLPHGIPDFCALTTNRLVILPNTSSSIPNGTDVSCIGVHGQATIPVNAVVKFDNFLVYEDGSLTVEANSELIFKGNDLDLTSDPEQFGEGFISFGDVTFRGWLNNQATIKIHSANPNGVRGHLMITGKSFAQIEGTFTYDLGRTNPDLSLDSATFDGDIPNHIGTNQIGRYGGWHFHFTRGPFPVKAPYQFIVKNNRMLRNGKWGGVVIHNSSFGLVESNSCTEATICYVEEAGSETKNTWQFNYAGQSINGLDCSFESGFNLGYDPEARCRTGFWFRQMNQIVKGNVVEDVQRGFTWWNLCLEADNPPCGWNVPLLAPLFPGADISDPTQIRSCTFADGSFRACLIGDTIPGIIEDNTVRRSITGIEFWWASRPQINAAPIKNSTFVDVKTPIFLRYTDAVFDTISLTGCELFINQVNDANVIRNIPGETWINHATATCSDAIFRRTGQLHLGPAYRYSNSTFTSPNGIHLRLGGQSGSNPLTSVVNVENSTFTGPIFTLSEATFDLTPGQTIIRTATNVNGMTFTDSQVIPGAPTEPPVIIPPTPTPINCVVSDWSAWSEWSAINMTTEQRTRTRSIITQPSSDGLACPALTETETRAIINVCTATPLNITGIKWPSGQTGNKSGSWNSGNFSLVKASFLWNPLRFEATDNRGCSFTKNK
jgi:hypothetical protein